MRLAIWVAYQQARVPRRPADPLRRSMRLPFPAGSAVSAAERAIDPRPPAKSAPPPFAKRLHGRPSPSALPTRQLALRAHGHQRAIGQGVLQLPAIYRRTSSIRGIALDPRPD